MLPNLPDESEKETGRIEAFSDGVFSIALTLLVLNIHVPAASQMPPGGLFRELVNQWPNYLAFIISFFFVLIMWINHHRLFQVIRRADNGLMLLNGLLLFGVTLVPFPTSLVAEYLQHPDSNVAVMVNNAWFFILSLFFNALWRYASYKNRLFSNKTDLKLVDTITRQYGWGPLLYGVGIALAFLSAPLGMLMTILFGVFFALPNKAVQQLLSGDPEETQAKE